MHNIYTVCDDPQWVPEREPREYVAARALEFLEWIRLRPEKRIGVVTHSGFLNVLFNAVLSEDGGMGNGGETWTTHSALYQRMCENWFEVSELRPTLLSFPASGQGVALLTHAAP